MLEIISIFISSILMVTTVYAFGIIISKKEYKTINIAEVSILLLIASLSHTLIFIYTNGITKTLILCLLYSLILSI